MLLVAVFDIDSTLANNTHRADLLKKRCSVCLYEPVPVGHHSPCPSCGSTSSTVNQSSWDKFLDADAVSKDTPIDSSVKILNKLRQDGVPIAFVTGRNRKSLGLVTEDWLRKYVGWQGHDIEPLFMREESEESLEASIYKNQALSKLKTQLNYIYDTSKFYFIFFEDDPHVFNVYNKHGLVVKCPQGCQYLYPKGADWVENSFSI